MRESLQLKVQVPASKKTPWKATKDIVQARGKLVFVLAIAPLAFASPTLAGGARGGAQALGKGGAPYKQEQMERMKQGRAACMSDIQAYCREFMGRPPEVRACLRQRAGALSPGCRSAMAGR